MANPTSEVLPTGLLMEKVPDLKRRQRSIYYRRITVKGGDMIWIQTGLLPSDPLGRLYYESKGFRLTPPGGTEFAPSSPEQKPEDKSEKDRQINALLEEVRLLRAEVEASKVKKRGRKAKAG